MDVNSVPTLTRLDDDLIHLLLSTSELSAKHIDVCQKIRQHSYEIGVLLAEHNAAVIKHVDDVNKIARSKLLKNAPGETNK